MNSITDICFEHIQDNYWFGQYGEFKVIIMKDCGYINATKLCSAGAKDFCFWKRNTHSQELINALMRQEASVFSAANSNTLPSGDHQICRLVCKSIMTENISSTNKLISGTYCHLS